MVYDLLIIGGSAAATSAGIYAARRGLNFKIITKNFGGEVATSGEIGNWPGIIKTDGIALSKQFKEHLEFYGVIPEEGVEVKKIAKQTDGLFQVSTQADGIEKAADYFARSVIVATGVRPKTLNVKGELEFRNKGLSYCTTCDGPLFSGMPVATIGGGNSALESALMLADIAPSVQIITIDPAFTGDEILVENLNTKKNVAKVFNAIVTEIIGKEFVSGVKYTVEGEEREVKVNGVFVHIGMVPNNKIMPDGVEKTPIGEIIVDKYCQTNLPGLFAAGDLTDTPFKQIVVASGQGVTAALSAVQYLNKIKK